MLMLLHCTIAQVWHVIRKLYFHCCKFCPYTTYYTSPDKFNKARNGNIKKNPVLFYETIIARSWLIKIATLFRLSDAVISVLIRPHSTSLPFVNGQFSDRLLLPWSIILSKGFAFARLFIYLLCLFAVSYVFYRFLLTFSALSDLSRLQKFCHYSCL